MNESVIMNELIVPWLVLCCLGCISLLFFEKRQWLMGICVSKPLAAIGYLGLAVCLGASESTYGLLILLALVLSFFGDVLLIPPDKPVLFLLGIGSFLLAHVVYGVAFYSLGFQWKIFIYACLVGLVSTFFVLRWLMPNVEGFFKIAVPLYTLTIMTMLALAVTAMIVSGGVLIAIGASLFAVSDLSVAKDRLIKPDFVTRAWGLPLYFLAQILLAMTVAL